MNLLVVDRCRHHRDVRRMGRRKYLGQAVHLVHPGQIYIAGLFPIERLMTIPCAAPLRLLAPSSMLRLFGRVPRVQGRLHYWLWIRHSRGTGVPTRKSLVYSYVRVCSRIQVWEIISIECSCTNTAPSEAIQRLIGQSGSRNSQ